MIALVRKHYVRFAERLDLLEIKKRVKALSNTKKEMAKRFMKLYAHFRHKKHGEKLPWQEEDEVTEIFSIEEEQRI